MVPNGSIPSQQLLSEKPICMGCKAKIPYSRLSRKTRANAYSYWLCSAKLLIENKDYVKCGIWLCQSKMLRTTGLLGIIKVKRKSSHNWALTVNFALMRCEALLMPILRQISSTFVPGSACFNAYAICSSANRLVLMACPLPGTLNHA